MTTETKINEIQIKNYWNNKIIIAGKYKSIKDCLEKNRDFDLRNSDLRNSNLRGSNLRGSLLSGSNLSGSNLRGSLLRDSDLRGSDLRDSNLRGSNLRGSLLSGSLLRGSDLRNSDLRGSDLRGSDLRGSLLSGSLLRGSKNYLSSHEFFQEIVRRQKVEIFTTEEWSAIAQIIIHILCWDTIKGRFDETAMSVFKKLKKAGFGEWEEKYKTL